MAEVIEIKESDDSYTDARADHVQTERTFVVHTDDGNDICVSVFEWRQNWCIVVDYWVPGYWVSVVNDNGKLTMYRTVCRYM